MTTAGIKGRQSLKAQQISESVFREVSRLAVVHKAINLGPGLPDSLYPPELIEAAKDALDHNIHQYAIIFGDRLLRESIAEQSQRMQGRVIDPETQITVTCGATEALYVTMLALIDPGDEVIVFEPFYESYGPNTLLCGAIPKYVSLHPPNWRFDETELEKAFSSKTRAIVLNSPQNPTGSVFSREELAVIARLCQKWGVVAITDEIYEHITYDDTEHLSLSSFDGMEDLTVSAHSLSKTFSVTGWRVGWAIANPVFSNAIRKVHDFVSAGTAAPLQRAAAKALALPASYYDNLRREYSVRRDHLMDTLKMTGMPFYAPRGAYYILADISGLGFDSDVEFVKNLIENVGVAAVPGSTFFRDASEIGRKYVRFCFSRQPQVLEEARARIAKSKLCVP
jgi:aminotransferase